VGSRNKYWISYFFRDSGYLGCDSGGMLQLRIAWVVLSCCFAQGLFD
jgi:hypothetical protein